MSELSKNWRTPEWKEEKGKLLEERGAVCEWCGHKAGDILEVESYNKKGKSLGTKQVKITLAPHHRDKTKFGLSEYKKESRSLFKDWAKQNPEQYQALVAQVRQTLPPGIEEKDIQDRVKFIWDNDNRALIQGEYQKRRDTHFEEYRSLERENVLVLCNRCHFAREKGLILCQTCKKNYHKPAYPSCYNCSKHR